MDHPVYNSNELNTNPATFTVGKERLFTDHLSGQSCRVIDTTSCYPKESALIFCTSLLDKTLLCSLRILHSLKILFFYIIYLLYLKITTKYTVHTQSDQGIRTMS